MPFVVIGVILVLLKVVEVGPTANLSWLWVLAPFGVAFIWWEVVAPMLGWDKRQAAKRMQKDHEEAQAWKKKTRGF